MEKLSLFFLLFIVVFLTYSYFKTKKNELEKETTEKKGNNSFLKNETAEYFVLTAAIAAVMDGKKYKTRNIFLEKQEKKHSSWKISGRNYTSQRRDRV